MSSTSFRGSKWQSSTIIYEGSEAIDIDSMSYSPQRRVRNGAKSVSESSQNKKQTGTLLQTTLCINFWVIWGSKYLNYAYLFRLDHNAILQIYHNKNPNNSGIGIALNHPELLMFHGGPPQKSNLQPDSHGVEIDPWGPRLRRVHEKTLWGDTPAGREAPVFASAIMKIGKRHWY